MVFLLILTHSIITFKLLALFQFLILTGTVHELNA